MHTRLSIIIPFYNPGRFLRTCLENLAAQYNEQVEIILINDGSTENVDEQIRFANNSFLNFKYLTYVQNQGVSNARNIGLQNAASDYTWFIDVDDVIERDAIMTIIQAIEGDLDVYQFAVNVVSDMTGEPLAIRAKIKDGQYCPPILPLDLGIPLYLWNHIIKTTLARSVRFDNTLRICEDRDYLFKIYKTALSLEVHGERIYRYFKRAGSASSNVTFAEIMLAGYMDMAELEYELPHLASMAGQNSLLERTNQIARVLLLSRPKSKDIEQYKAFYKATQRFTNGRILPANDNLAKIIYKLPTPAIKLIGGLLSSVYRVIRRKSQNKLKLDLDR